MQLTKATTRSVAVLAVLTALSFLVAACGGGPAHNGGGRTGSALPPALAAQTRQRIAFVRCMRAHGVRNFPYPTAEGAVSVEMVEAAGINPKSPAVVRVVAKCLPPSLRPPKLPMPSLKTKPRRSDRSYGAGATTQAAVTVNAAKHYQSIAGFGVSEGFGQAKTLMSAPASVQEQVLSLLYSPTHGAGLTILRNEISADAGFTIEPKAPSSPNAKPSYLSLAEVDQDQGQLWFAKQIKADYGVSDIFADAWSAPAFMKTNNSAIRGGTVCGVPGANCKSGDWRQAYANYLVQYAKDYAAAGVPLTYIGPENETTIAPPQDSMIMSPAQTANFMEVLGATLARSGLSTRAECCASIGWNYAQQYAAAIETDKAANTATALFTSHGYFFPPNSPLKGWSKPVWETEWAPFDTGPFDPAWDDGSLLSGFTWAQNIYTGLTKANLERVPLPLGREHEHDDHHRSQYRAG